MDTRKIIHAKINVMEWINVNDRLPEHGVEVLCISEEGRISVEERMKGQEWIYCDKTDSGNATHWMPLPPPPKK